MGGVMFRAVTDKNPPDAVSRLQSDTVAQDLAAARSRYSEPLLRAIGWAMMVKPELRPQSIAEWQAAFAAQAALSSKTAAAAAEPATRTAATVAMATRPASSVRPARLTRDHGSGWRRVGWAAALLFAAVIALGWYKRRPEPPPAAVAAPAPQPAPALPPAAPAPPSPQTGTGLADLPSREVPPAADPRERPPRPDERSPVPDRVSGEFRGADRDGDGYLSPAEVEGRFPFIARDFNRVDRDGDRRISADEFADLRRMQSEKRRLPPPPPRP